VFSFVLLLPSCTPLSSKNLVYIKCSLVVGFSISITLFCLPCCLTDKSIVSNFCSSVSSSASSTTQVVIPCRDLRFAVWSPLDVLIPLKIILLPVFLFSISSLVMWKSCTQLKSSSLSINSGIIDMYAEVNVYLVNRIVCPASYVSIT